MKKFLNLLVFMGLALFLFYGCYPTEDITYSDTDVAVTRFDDAYNFEANSICVLFDTVAHIVDEGSEPKSGKYDSYILDELEKNLKETKFTVYRVKDSTELLALGVTPDAISLVVTTTVMETDFYNYYYYPYYDYWYWGWGWGYWKKSGSLKSTNNVNYYYYPWYPWGGGTYYSYSVGTVMVEMIDAKSIGEALQGATTDSEIKLPVVWTSIISGILSGNTSDQESRITNKLKQSFDQSPYLQ